MKPQASSPLSLAQTVTGDPERAPSPAIAAADQHRFHEAFSKASRITPLAPTARGDARSPEPSAPTRASDERPREVRAEARASTARRPERAERHRSDAGTERNQDAAPPCETAETAGTTREASSQENREVARDEPIDRTTAGVPTDLLAFFQGATSPIVVTENPIALGAPGASSDGLIEGLAGPGAEGRGLARAGVLGDTGHTSEATLNHLADAFARAERMHAGPEAVPLEGAGALSTEGMQLSSEARALLEVRPAEGAAARALASGHAHAALGEAPLARAEGPSSDGTGTAGTSIEGGLAANVASADLAGGRSQGGLDHDRGASSHGDDSLSRDGFASAANRIDEGSGAHAAHGAFGADPRLQGALDGKASPEARLEQAKAASEHILERIERLTEQRAAGRELVIATDRGPVRVRVDVAEKNVSVHFHADDDQLKNLLRSGLPALQATLAKRGFGATEFQFDGDGTSDLMANSGGSKYRDARAIRESRLGEAMIEPLGIAGTPASKADPRALLSVTA